MKLSDKIAVLRRKRGWSQEELAEWLSVSRQSISRWESGRAAPDAANIVRLSRLFNVSTDWLLLDEHGLADAPDGIEDEILSLDNSPLPAEEEILVAEALPSDESPSEESTIRRIRASDTYEFVIFCQGEAHRYAWACASIPLGPAIWFLLWALGALFGGDSEMVFVLMGIFIGGISVLMGLCELLCSWLGKSERRLNGGKPYILEPNALAWVNDACNLSLKKLESRTAAAWSISALSVPAYILCMCADPYFDTLLWGALSFAIPSVFITIAVFLRSYASRMHRCYRHLLDRARQENNPDSTDG